MSVSPERRNFQKLALRYRSVWWRLSSTRGHPLTADRDQRTDGQGTAEGPTCPSAGGGRSQGWFGPRRQAPLFLLDTAQSGGGGRPPLGVQSPPPQPIASAQVADCGRDQRGGQAR